ncbi:MAG: TolC family protein [Bacteroidota bacterium]
MKRFIITFALFLPLLLQAQTQLSLQSALDTALRNNLDIQIAKNYVQIAKASNNYGYAGGLPYINATASDNLGLNSINQKYSTGAETNESNILGNGINTGISANIVLFNGFKVMATKKRLGLIQKQSEIELNAQVQDLIAAVMLKYYDIIRQQGNLRIMQSVFEMSQKKLDIVNEKKAVGMANGVVIMQAQSDVNTARQNLTTQQLIIEQEKNELMQLINSRQKPDFTISDSITIDGSLVLDSINTYLKRNPYLQSAEEQVRINEQLLRETNAQRYPSLKLNTAYNFGRSEYNSGYTLLNQNYGPTVGLTIAVPIFNSNVYHTQKIVAGLNVSNAKLQKENLSHSLETTVVNKYNAYTTTLQQIASQQQNFALAKQLMELVLQNFQLGQATILEVKAAQASYESAAYQLINFQYAAKSAEIQLKQLIYQLRY